MIGRRIWVHLDHERTKPLGYLPMAQVFEATGTDFTVYHLYGSREPVPTPHDADNIMLPRVGKWLIAHGWEKPVDIYTPRE